MYCKKSKLFTWILLISLIISQFTIFDKYAEATEVDLLITGTGLKEDVKIAASDWSEYNLTERFYSTNNSLSFHKIIKTKGYDLFELIGSDNLKTDEDYAVKITCSDGFEFSKTVSELQNTYYYSDFTDKSKTGSSPMIAKYTAVLADFPKNSFAPPVTWTDRPLTENDLDKDFPKLVFGQTDIDDMNMSKWGKDIVKITIGDDRPTENSSNTNLNINSSYKHISNDGAPYNIDAITSATFTIEGPAVEGYRAISLRQIEEDLEGQELGFYYEKIDGKIVNNSYEGINAKYLIDNYVKAKSNAGNVIFKDKSRQTILNVPIEETDKYLIAYGVNEVPLVFLDTDVGYRSNKYNDNGCFKLIYEQEATDAKEFSNVAYIYIEEKDAKNIYEHTYAPYNTPKYTDYELIIHGDALGKEIRYKVSDIEAMTDIQIVDEYSLSNSEYFWYYNIFKGVSLWDLLLEAGLNPRIDEDTSIQFIAADNYNFPPMTIREIKDDSLYGYYEKDALDKGDGTFNGESVKPLYTDMPVIVAYGFNGYPYVTRPTDEGFNPGLGNDGGPLRVIFGKTGYNDTNGSNQVQYLKEIIIGEGEPILTGSSGTGTGEITQTEISKDSSWNHNQGVYTEFLDKPVLRVTGSQVKEPMTFTLRQIESMTKHAVRDVYTGDGIHEFEGVVLWDIISEVVGLKDDVVTPNIRVFSGQNYNQILRSSEQVINGVLNSQGKVKDIILAYAIDGYPLVPNSGDIGYANNNAYGPLRLIIEESKSMWVKWTDCIVVGSGDYEAPEMKDVKEIKFAELKEPEDVEEQITESNIWLIYKNDTGKELPEASIRSMEYDKSGNLWIGTNNGGLSVRSPKGLWSHYKEIETANCGKVAVDTSYAIVQRENEELWIALGSPVVPKGILIKNDNEWRILNSENSDLPSDFVQELELDGNGGIWIGTGLGAVHIDKDDNWTVYNKNNGLALDSIDAIEPDDKGGVWLGFYPATEGTGENMKTFGAYQYIDKDGNITTYDNFDNTNFNVNWVRSISIDNNGGVWITRSGNAPGYTQGVVDYIKDGVRTEYTAKDLYPNIDSQDDIRFVLADDETLYIGTKGSGVLVTEAVGKISDKISASNKFPNNKWNNIYFMDIDGENFFVGSNGGAAVLTAVKTFSDISNHWAKNDIENMTTMGYINGEKGKYRPDDNITRAEFVSLMVRILGLDTKDIINPQFSDVKSTDWYFRDVALAKEYGLVKGYTDNTLKPNANITRQEIASILSTLLNESLSEAQINEVLSEYTDEIPDWAKEAVAESTKTEIIKGLPNNIFGGSQNATRAQSAVMLLRFLKY